MQKFDLGQTVATKGAMAYLQEHSPKHMSGAWSLLSRHQSGDWGSMCKEDKALNDDALLHGGRLMSSYEIGPGKVWVITESDRSVTTILLPEEY